LSDPDSRNRGGFAVRRRKKSEKSFAEEFAEIITLDEDDPDSQAQYLIQKDLRIEKQEAVESKL